MPCKNYFSSDCSHSRTSVFNSPEKLAPHRFFEPSLNNIKVAGSEVGGNKVGVQDIQFYIFYCREI